MKKYCVDTSGFSNPFETMPEDIHGPMWKKVKNVIASGDLAVTVEIFDEMIAIGGTLGPFIKANKQALVLDVNDSSWNWQAYKKSAASMQVTHKQFISEYNGGSRKTVCLNDISIVALAQALKLPLLSMESLVTDPSSKKRRIPNICAAENVQHLWFNDFLRLEKIQN